MTADVVFSAFVLTLVPDAGPFLTKLDAAARRHVVLYLGAYCQDAVLAPLRRHFHGAARVPGPSYIDALAVLRELGVAAEVKAVEIVTADGSRRSTRPAEHYRDALLLPDNRDVRRELAGLLPSWLLGRAGAFRSPLRTVPAAIIEWKPGTSA